MDKINLRLEMPVIEWDGQKSNLSGKLRLP